MVQNNEKNKYKSPDGRFVLSYPDSWEIETDDDCTTLFRESGVGALQISAYEVDREQSAEEILKEYLEDEKIKSEIESFNTNTGQRWATSAYEISDLYTKVWVVMEREHLLFITYNCEASFQNEELEDVTQILGSIELNS